MACLLDDAALMYAWVFATDFMYLRAELKHARCANYVCFHNCHVRRQ